MPNLDLPPEGSLQWAEELYMHGMADEVSGNVEAPMGHFYRVERWIVMTDSQGNNDISEYDDEKRAMAEFQSRDDEYSDWEDN